MRAFALPIAVAALLTLVPSLGNAQANRTHTVSEILLDGKPVTSASGVTVTPRIGNGRARDPAARGDT